MKWRGAYLADAMLLAGLAECHAQQLKYIILGQNTLWEIEFKTQISPALQFEETQFLMSMGYRVKSAD